MLQSAIAQLEGLRGSDEIADAAAVLDLILWFQQQPGELELRARETTVEQSTGQSTGLDSGRLVWILQQFASTGSAMMQGVGNAGQFLMGVLGDETFGMTLSSWVTGAVNR